MVVVLSLSANAQFCPSKMFRTPVTPHATNLLLSEITVCRMAALLTDWDSSVILSVQQGLLWNSFNPHSFREDLSNLKPEGRRLVRMAIFHMFV